MWVRLSTLRDLSRNVVEGIHALELNPPTIPMNNRRKTHTLVRNLFPLTPLTHAHAARFLELECFQRLLARHSALASFVLLLSNHVHKDFYGFNNSNKW